MGHRKTPGVHMLATPDAFTPPIAHSAAPPRGRYDTCDTYDTYDT